MQNLRIVIAVAKDAAEHALIYRKRRILDKGLGIDDLLEAQAIALGTRAVRGIEGKIARLQVVDGMAMLRTGKRQGVGKQVPFCSLGRVAVGQQVDLDVIMRELGRLLYALGDTAQTVLANHDAVHDHLDIMLVFFIQLNRIVERADLTVHAHARETLAAQVFKQLGKLTLTAANHRRHDKGAAPLPRLQNLVRHLVGSLALDHAPALGAVGHADARKQQTQVVVDLRYRSHC